MDVMMFIIGIAVVCVCFLLGARLDLAGMLIATTVAAVALVASGYSWNNSRSETARTVASFATFTSAVGSAFLWISWFLCSPQ